MITIMSDFVPWLNDQLNERGWSYNELARRADVSGGSISHIMNQRKNPGYDVCVGIARALEIPPENVLRRAGLLPALPPEVEEEREMVALARRLSGQARQVILTTMRSLLGMAARPPQEAVSEPPAADEAAGPLHEWLAAQLARQLSQMRPEDQQRVFDVMKEIRAREGEQGANEGDVPVVS